MTVKSSVSGWSVSRPRRSTSGLSVRKLLGPAALRPAEASGSRAAGRRRRPGSAGAMTMPGEQRDAADERGRVDQRRVRAEPAAAAPRPVRSRAAPGAGASGTRARRSRSRSSSRCGARSVPSVDANTKSRSDGTTAASVASDRNASASAVAATTRGEHHAEQQHAVGDRHRRATGAEHCQPSPSRWASASSVPGPGEAVGGARRRDHPARRRAATTDDRDDDEHRARPAPAARDRADRVGEERGADDRERERAVVEHPPEPERGRDRQRGERGRGVQPGPVGRSSAASPGPRRAPAVTIAASHASANAPGGPVDRSTDAGRRPRRRRAGLGSRPGGTSTSGALGRAERGDRVELRAGRASPYRDEQAAAHLRPAAGGRRRRGGRARPARTTASWSMISASTADAVAAGRCR